MIDWTAGRIRTALLVAVDYIADGEKKTARWCGPADKIPSGLPGLTLPSTLDVEGDGVAHSYEPRIGGASIDVDLGPLSNTVQTASDLTLAVDLEGSADDPTSDPLYEHARAGRWAGRPVRAWKFDLETGASAIVFDGTCDKDPTPVEWDGFRLRATDEPLGASATWPQTRMPRTDEMGGYVPELGVDVFTGGGGVWNPEATSGSVGWAIPENVQGRFVGTIHSNFGVFRDIYFYGSRSIAASTDYYLFFHVTPQKYAGGPGAVVYYESPEDAPARPDATIEGATSFDVFTCHDWRIGPVGTNIRVRESINDFVVFPSDDSTPRWVAQLGAPVASIASVQASGAVEVHTAGSGGSRDTLVTTVPDVFTLAGGAAALHPGAATELNTLPDGGVTGALDAAVPAGLEDRPLSLREGLGTLGRVFGIDFCRRRESGRLPVFPAIRRPNRLSPDADHNARRGDLAAGPDEPPPWRILSDPHGHYAVTVSVTGIGRAIQPHVTEPLDIQPTLQDQGAFFSDAEYQATGTRIRGAVTFKHWRSRLGANRTGFYAAAEKQQRQVWVIARHGWKANAFQVAETLAYDVPGLPSEVGQIRRLRHDIETDTVEVTTVHVEFFPNPAQAGEED